MAPKQRCHDRRCAYADADKRLLTGRRPASEARQQISPKRRAAANRSAFSQPFRQPSL